MGFPWVPSREKPFRTLVDEYWPSFRIAVLMVSAAGSTSCSAGAEDSTKPGTVDVGGGS